MSEIGPEGQEFLAALARGDEEAQKIQDLHEISTKAASGLLELAAEHYAACRVAASGAPRRRPAESPRWPATCEGLTR